MVRQILRQGVVALAATTALVAAVTFTRPVFLGRAPVAERLITPDPALIASREARLRAPWVVNAADEAVRSAAFEGDVRAFTSDLLATGRMRAARAERVARIAVTEAYHRRVPPALVFGVMLAENARFESGARSTVGAVGLMQVYPKVWLRPLARHFGRRLSDDSTNLRYGVYILGHYVHRVSDTLSEHESWRKPLLRYNGCARGTNTRNCHSYPDKVRRHVENEARALCAGLSFEQCVSRPLWLSLREGARPAQRRPDAARPTVPNGAVTVSAIALNEGTRRRESGTGGE